jgi:hypothetical protein
MFANLRGPAFLRRRPRVFPRCYSQAWLLCFAFVFGRACGALPSVPFLGHEPSDPYVRVPAANYQSVVAPYVRLRPAKPGNWKQQNESVAPQGGTPAHKH